uniref:Uncharacterized protein n=1 Tax=Arundo donax TaxID=35708 RepID=A0A0A9BX87_ARUDO
MEFTSVHFQKLWKMHTENNLQALTWPQVLYHATSTPHQYNIIQLGWTFIVAIKRTLFS